MKIGIIGKIIGKSIIVYNGFSTYRFYADWQNSIVYCSNMSIFDVADSLSPEEIMESIKEGAVWKIEIDKCSHPARLIDVFEPIVSDYKKVALKMSYKIGLNVVHNLDTLQLFLMSIGTLTDKTFFDEAIENFKNGLDASKKTPEFEKCKLMHAISHIE